MSFTLQLKLLVWKNYTLRKRHWGRLLVEIVWPLFLFIILFLVRLRGLKKYHHECHFEEKVMPSAGVLPFVQSFICTFNNTCHRSLWSEPGRLQSYNQSFVTRLVEDIEGAFTQNFDSEEKVASLSRVAQDFALLRDLAVKIRDGQVAPTDSDASLVRISSLLKSPEVFFTEMNKFVILKKVKISPQMIRKLTETDIKIDSLSSGSLSRLMGNPRKSLCEGELTSNIISSSEDKANVDDILSSLCNLSVSDWNDLRKLLQKNIDSDAVSKEVNNFVESNVGAELGFEQWSTFANLSSDIAQDLALAQSIGKIFRDIQDASREMRESLPQNLSSSMSIMNSSSTANNSAEVRDVFSSLQTISRLFCGRNLSTNTFSSGGAANRFDNLRDQIKEKDDDKFKYKYDNSTTKECNHLIQSWEKSPGVRFLWSQIKPLFRGKILYTPDTPATRRLIKLVNTTFQPIENLKSFINDWNANYTKQLQDFLLDENNQNFLKDLFTSTEDGNMLEFLSTIQGRNEAAENNINVTEIRQQFAGLFEGNFNETWKQSLDSLDVLTQNISKYLECFEMQKFEPVKTEIDLEKKGLELMKTNKLWAGLVFLDFKPGQKDIPRFVTYKIRIDADKVDSTKRVEDRLARPGARKRPGIDLKYLYYGFAYLQDMVEHAIIEEHSGRNMSSLPGISLQQMPYPCYIEDRFIIAIARTFPLFMTLAWVYSASMIIKSIVHEKEMRLKETMRVMGLGNAVHWCSWFIDSFTVMFISCILLTIILVNGNLLENSDPSLVFCFMLTYTISTIMLAFLISTLFSRANIAAAAGGIIFFMLYLPYSFMVVWEENLDPSAKIISCLISNIAFGFGCSYFSHYEETAVGAQWDNIWESPLIGDNLSMAGCMGMLLVDSLVYGLLMWYIEAVFPGEFGVPKPYYFFLTKSYWLDKQGHSTVYYDSEDSNDLPLGERPNQNETEPNHLPLGVSVRHMHKVYPNGKVAVEDLNLNFYEGQITSFLGHNGAGKTTTISILTGLFPPSAGTALINGLDIQTEMDRIRRSLGTCPQHNVLFQELTVEEHLWFYARLKGQQPDEVNAQSSQMVCDLGIPHKKDEMSMNLSGGMQRKLSIACAFIGGSKVVVLDEPTAGVDPYSRRAIWDLLIKYKAGRTIILTTHFMDEADLLGDRIAIINCGKLVCCGSSLFLKSIYGVGYYLTLVKTSEDERQDSGIPFHNIVRVETSSRSNSAISVDTLNDIEDEGISDISTNETIINPSNANEKFPVYPLTKFIQKHVPTARLVEEIGSDIVFVLPVEGEKENAMKHFENLFNELDKNLKKLNISTYGLSDTTLEEIFLKVASNENDGEIMRGGNLGPDNGIVPPRVRTSISRNIFKKTAQVEDDSDESGLRKVKVMVEGNRTAYTEVPVGDVDDKVLTRQSNPNNPVEKSTGHSLVMKHIMALEIKRFHHSKRNRKGFICEIILPAFFVCIAMIFTLILPPLVEEPQLEISPWIYPGKGGPNSVFFAQDDTKGDWSQRYKNELLSNNSFGTKCLTSTKDECKVDPWPSFEKFSSAPSRTFFRDNKNPDCDCSQGTQFCPANSFWPSPPEMKIQTGDVLIDMTSRNLSQWLLKTRHDYYKQRYGGFEFGVKNPLSDIDVENLQEVFTKLDQSSNMGNDRLGWFPKSLIFGNIENTIRESMAFDNIRVWFNNKGWASSVAYMNAANNMVLRAAVRQKEREDVLMDLEEAAEHYDRSKYGIKLINHPMNYTESQLDKELIRQVGISLLHAICVIFAMSFVPASFIVFHIEERVSKVKHMHFVSGVGSTTYWTAALIWDMTMYIFSAGLCIVIFLVFKAQAYVSEENLGPLIVLMLLYGWASVPLMYPASFVFSVPSSAFVTLSCANLFIGIITTVTTFVLENFDDEELKYIGSILKEVFLVFPHYCLGRGLMDMATEQTLNTVIAKFGLESVRSRFAYDFLGKYMLCMFVQGILFLVITLTVQSRFWQRFTNVREETEDKQNVIEDESVDEDVKRERQRILSSEIGSDVLQVKKLFKRYSKSSRQAVDKLTFGVQKGECFGLLGVNGAGKTTTFKMLTGDTNVTAGEAFVNGFSILNQMDKVRQSLGYCPQFDALDPLLTGREHLRLYARLRGLDEPSAKKATEWGLRKLGLTAYSDRCAGTYSGGNKRKLSTAIALIGNPSIVFLDEPTSGMDPGARRFLWNSILEMVKGGQSVVLTSHSMEECEALCSRLGIMVNGQFKCLGSIQHLKNRFGSGYTLTIRCDDGKTEEVHEKVTDLLPEAELKEEHHTQLQFQLPLRGTKLPVIFRHMEECRLLGILEDYSLTQTTLDEVFVRFASEQTELLEDEKKPRNLKRKILEKIRKSQNNTEETTFSVNV